MAQTLLRLRSSWRRTTGPGLCWLLSTGKGADWGVERGMSRGWGLGFMQDMHILAKEALNR